MRKSISRYIDKLGVGVSAMCMIHCFLTPILILFAAGVGFWKDLHIYFALMIILITPIAVYNGYQHHKNMKFSLLLIAGAVLVVFADPVSSLFAIGYQLTVDISVTTAGSLLLIRGHFLNSRRGVFQCTGFCHR